MKFSIVITTYNRLALLKRAIHSALNQTLACEVVVADDGSTDGTEEYVRQFSHSLKQAGDHRLIYYRNSKNSGHAATMNAGVEVATGDWVKPVDDDDYLDAHCIATMAEAIATHEAKVFPHSQSHAVLCSCQAAQVDPEGKELSRTRIVGPGKAFYIPQRHIHWGMLLEQVPFGTPIQVAFRRDIFLQSGGWDSSLDANCDDIDSWIRMAQFGDGIFINQCLAYRTIWPGAYNQTFSLQKRLETNILMKEKIYALIPNQSQKKIPSIHSIRQYLKLHWGLVALKKSQFTKAAQLSASAYFSPQAWGILITSLANRQLQKFPEFFPAFCLESLEENQPVLSTSQGQDILSSFSLESARNSQQQETLRAELSGIALSVSDNNLPVEQLLQGSGNPRASETVQAWITAIESSQFFLNYQSQLNIHQIQELRSYLKVRCSVVAFQQRKIKDVLSFLFPTLFSLSAWKYLTSLIIVQTQRKALIIPKQVLIESV